MRRLSVATRPVIAVCLLFAAFVSKADDAVPVDFILAGIATERETLRQGQYRITGHVEASNHECCGGEPLSADVSAFVAFDHDEGMYRLDSVVPECVVDEGGNLKRRETRTTRSVFTPQQGLFWRSYRDDELDGQVQIIPAGTAVDAGDMMHLDVRLPGLTTEVGYALSHKPHERYPDFAEWMDYLGGLKGTTSRLSDGLVELDIVTDVAKPRRIRAIVNESRGFTAERVEFETLDVDDGFHSVSSATWDRFQDIWVPVSLEIDTHKPDGSHRVWTLAFEWESVNQPIDAGLFTEASVGTAVRVPEVVDWRTGKPLLVSGPDTVRGDVVREQIQHIEAQGGAGWFAWIVAGCSIVVLAATAFLLIRRQRA